MSGLFQGRQDQLKEQALPVGLKLIAGIFIFEGLLEGVYALLQLNEGNVHIPIGMVSLFIGVGLLRRRPGWRTGARVVLVLSMGAAAWALFNLIDQPDPVRLAFGEFSSGAFYWIYFWNIFNKNMGIQVPEPQRHPHAFQPEE